MKSFVVVPDEAGRWLAGARQLRFTSQMQGESRRTNIVDTGPHSAQHHQHTAPANARLHPVPDTISPGSGKEKIDRNAWTYQAIAARLNVVHKLPYSPKLVRATTGKVT
jgi:hypothetical protein